MVTACGRINVTLTMQILVSRPTEYARLRLLNGWFEPEAAVGIMKYHFSVWLLPG